MSRSSVPLMSTLLPTRVYVLYRAAAQIERPADTHGGRGSHSPCPRDALEPPPPNPPIYNLRGTDN